MKEYCISKEEEEDQSGDVIYPVLKGSGFVKWWGNTFAKGIDYDFFYQGNWFVWCKNKWRPWSVRSKFLANKNSTCHKNIR